ncbi:MAG: nuclear transport factor 2 family protein [Candidatus Acidiferrales bacterium]
MKTRLISLVSLVLLFACVTAVAQEPVVPAADPESLFTDPNPQLNANKQVAFHIERDLLEANHWDEAGKWITDRYIQHNPMVKSGLAPVVAFFEATRKPSPIPEHMKTPVVAVVADGDLVIVVTARTLKNPRDPSQTYTTSWFDMWRIKDGKADEHWDAATLPALGATAGPKTDN